MEDKHQIGDCSSGRPHISGMIRPPTARAPLRLLVSLFLSVGLCSLLLLKIGLPVSPMSLIWRYHDALLTHQVPQILPDAVRIMTENATKVPLEAHIMSKCPDARDCLKELVVPAMEAIVDKVDFRLSFIGEYACLCPADVLAFLDDLTNQCLPQTRCRGVHTLQTWPD